MVVQKGSSKPASKGNAASSKTASQSGAKARSKVDPKPAAAKGIAKVAKHAAPVKKLAGTGKASTLTHGSVAKASSVTTQGSKAVHSSAKATSHKVSDLKAASAIPTQKSKIDLSMKSVNSVLSKASSLSKVAHKKAGSSHRSLSELGSETVCREVACEGLATSGGYCRLHYIKNWKKIKRKESILREKRLNQYIEELVVKYPDKYIEAIRQDLANDKDFAKVIYDLDLDEGVDDFDVEGGDSVDSLIDNIKRDFDDEGDGF